MPHWFGIRFEKATIYGIIIGLTVGVLLAASEVVIGLLAGGLQHAIPGMAPEHNTLGQKVGVIVGAPFIEEIIWRHALFGALLLSMVKIGVRHSVALVTALIYSSVMFALAHHRKTPVGWLFTGLSGAAYAAIYYYGRRNLSASMSAHGSSNAFAVFI